MKRLIGKKVLFISPKFFGYEKIIYNKLNNFCSKVDYIDDRPENTVFVKAVLRIHHKLLYKKLIKYYDEKFEIIKNNEYDYVFILNPEGMLPTVIEKFRNHFNKSKFILYMWDSIKNRKHTPSVLKFFDKKYSFDSNDVIHFNDVIFRPLFYSDEYKLDISVTKKTLSKYDFVFVGTGHSDRYYLVKKIFAALPSKLKTYSFFFLNSKKYFWFRKFTEKQFFKVAKLEDFSFMPLQSAEIISIFTQSRVVIDINHPKQKGLTMRTLEVLALQKKMVTTNTTIKNYDFYDENNIQILDRDDPKIDISFLEKPFKEVGEEILAKYSLEGWLKEIFFLHE